MLYQCEKSFSCVLLSGLCKIIIIIILHWQEGTFISKPFFVFVVSEPGLRDPDLLDLRLYEIPFPYLWCLKHLSALRLMRKRAEGPGMQQAHPRNQQSCLAPPPCLFALTSGSLPGYWTCSLKGAFVLQESAANMYHRGRGCREPRLLGCCRFLNQPPPPFTLFNQG